MAVFIELTTDPFEENRRNQTSIQRGGEDSTTTGGRRIARRPLRGLEIKEDRVAAIKVVQSDGTEIPLVDAGSPYGDGQTSSGYTNFVLQSVNEARMEKHQIVETFGESYIFFFGEAPRFLDVQMIVINSHDFNWEAEWWENYERYFRGTRLVEMGARLYMFYDDNVVEGYMLNSTGAKVSDQPFIVQMNFRLFLTGYRNITFVGDPQFPIRSSVVLPAGINLTDPNAADAIISNLRDVALSEAQAAGAQDSESVLASGQPGFSDRTRLSNFLRSAPESNAFSPSTVQLVEQLSGEDLVTIERTSGLRGKISDNQDEYLGVVDEITAGSGYVAGSVGVPLIQAPTVRSLQEVEDLHQEAIRQMEAVGANINNPQAMQGIGLMPLFDRGSDRAGIGFGAGTGLTARSGGAGSGPGSSATFTPVAGASFGTSLTTNTVAANAAYSQQSQDPLGAVYGGGSEQQINDRANTQGAGDREYGYNSDYAMRPGFGRPGYGDYGGNGFGSGQGEDGDPGFISPDLFSFDGVSEHPAAFSRFNKPRRNNTVFGGGGLGGTTRIGLGASVGGPAGGASSSIGGKPSSFAIISTDGDLFVESIGF